jgi:hypothetical protein
MAAADGDAAVGGAEDGAAARGIRTSLRLDLQPGLSNRSRGKRRR